VPSDLTDRIRRELPHVRWLGGSAGAGKTTVARRLAADYSLTLVSIDTRFEDHIRRADPRRHRRLLALAGRPAARLWERSAAELAAELAGFYDDELELVVEDLAALPAGEPVLAEGAGLHPTPLAAAGAVPGRAVWLIAHADLRRHRCRERLADPAIAALLAASPDPGAAFARWLERDDRWAAELAAAAHRAGAPVVEVDGGVPAGGVAARVAALLGLGAPGSSPRS
jgi:hypothetical protein